MCVLSYDPLRVHPILYLEPCKGSASGHNMQPQNYETISAGESDQQENDYTCRLAFIQYRSGVWKCPKSIPPQDPSRSIGQILWTQGCTIFVQYWAWVSAPTWREHSSSQDLHWINIGLSKKTYEAPRFWMQAACGVQKNRHEPKDLNRPEVGLSRLGSTANGIKGVCARFHDL